MNRVLVCAASILVLATLALARARADEPPAAHAAPAFGSMKIGDKAPGLAVSKWIRGEPVKSFDDRTVYIVEFWATWCGPCRETIPHLTQLQKDNPDKLRVVGVTSFDPNNTLKEAETFVRHMGDKMEYAVAFDKGDDTYSAYMQGAGRTTIPTAFIVDRDGTIAWIGHPASIDKALKQVLDHTWDKAAFAKTFEATRAYQVSKYHFEIALKKKNAADVQTYGRRMLDASANNAKELEELASAIVDPAAKLDLKGNPDLLNLAHEAAVKADDLTKSKNVDVLATLARCRFLKGMKAEAIEAQQKAISLARSAKKPELEKALKEYQKN